MTMSYTTLGDLGLTAAMPTYKPTGGPSWLVLLGRGAGKIAEATRKAAIAVAARMKEQSEMARSYRIYHQLSPQAQERIKRSEGGAPYRIYDRLDPAAQERLRRGQAPFSR